jgi:Multiubiquitin
MNNEQQQEKQTKQVTVIFNTRPKLINKERISFDEVIAYSFDTPPSGDGVQFTVQYTHGHVDKPKGTLVEGESVKVKDGMEFDVTPTNRS